MSDDVVTIDQDGKTGMMAFSFGDPEPVLESRTLLGMMMAWQNGRYYEPPISLVGLARTMTLSTHHASAINLKVNLLTASFAPTRFVTRATFRKFAKEFLLIGNAYLERVDNIAGRAMMMKHSPSLYTRRGVEGGSYFWVPSWKNESEFKRGSMCHLIEYDPEQEIYGLPQWLSALQPALLNEAATLFRRRYYLNGSHAGFIMYLSEPTMSNEDAEAIRTALKDTKGLGNFKNLFLHAPAGKKDGVQLIPISEVGAKDEFLGIKETTRDDVLSAHRVPPQLIGVVPKNNGGFGDADKAMNVFFVNEIEPIQDQMREVNDWLGDLAITFRDYVPHGAKPAA